MPPSRLRVAVEVNGDVHASQWLGAMGQRAYRTAPLMAAITEQLAEISRKRIEEGNYLPLTEGTIARKEAHGENTDIFRDEWRPIKGTPTRQGDALYRALTMTGAPGQVRYSTRTWAVFGVDSKGQGPLFYARFVQNVRGRKRRILAIPASEAVVIAETVSNWITNPKWSWVGGSLSGPGLSTGGAVAPK